jgi:hypothetical protein
MAKGSGGAGRGRGGNDGRGGKGTGSNKRKQDKDDDGWTRSVWDVRGPKDKPKEKATPVKRQMIDKAVRVPVNTNPRGLTKTMRALQNQLRDLAKSRGYGDDDPIPGTGGLTMRKLKRNAASRSAQEGEMRAAISALLRNPNDRGRPARPASRPSRPASSGRPARPAAGPIEIPRF